MSKGAKRKKAARAYNTVKTSEEDETGTGLLSSDSGHSTDTDIDEIVQEYKVNSEVMSGIDLKKPSRRSGMITLMALLSTTVISLLISRELSVSQFAFIPWYILGLAVSLLVLHVQPLRSEEETSTFTSILNFLAFVITTVLFGVIIISVWAPVLLWALLGAILYFHNEIGTALFKIHSRESSDSTKPAVAHLPPPKIKIRLEAIQIRTKQPTA